MGLLKERNKFKWHRLYKKLSIMFQYQGGGGGGGWGEGERGEGRGGGGGGGGGGGFLEMFRDTLFNQKSSGKLTETRTLQLLD